MENFDIIIVGAGLSGIGMAYHLQEKCPGKSYVILEGRDAIGGTWDLFRYPGIRSDSDMHTLGYNFKPWREAKSIADGPSILNYIKETAIENGIDRHIRYGHLVEKASWSSESFLWEVEARHKNTAEMVRMSGNFLLMCAGYYSYREGYTPEFPGREHFSGQIIHPQDWPEQLDYRNKKIIIIGSGATAVTLVPELAKKAQHVVMVQRSPTYMASGPDKDKIANFLRKILPEKMAYAIARKKNILRQQLFYRLTRTHPKKIKQWLIGMVRKELGPNYDVDKHFTPNYNPWDQRVCLVANSDLFHALKSGKASIVTDHIESFEKKGLLLKSGKELPADIIITATGLKLIVLGEVPFSVDEKPVDFAQSYSYKSIMFSDVPNLISTFGYVNASWTLRADLIAEYTCRLINYMEQNKLKQCTPKLREQDQNMSARPWIDGFSSNYIQRVAHLFPRQGDYEPWINPQNYRRDKKIFRHAPVNDNVMFFS